MSKVSTMSRMTFFGGGNNRRSSNSMMKLDGTSAKFKTFLESSPEPRTKIPVGGRKFVPILESGGVQVTCNPITGHT